jgi:hypothetical protein
MNVKRRRAPLGKIPTTGEIAARLAELSRERTELYALLRVARLREGPRSRSPGGGPKG